MNIGVNIRRLRLEKELTQERLAAMIGITSQAVSKWEREEGLPDITLLPALSAALDCSTDELLGISRELTREELDVILKKSADLVFGDCSEDALKNPDPDAGIEYLRAELEKHPAEWHIRVQLANFLDLSLQLSGFDEEKLREQVEHYDYIRLKAPDINSSRIGVIGLVKTYSALGTLEKADEVARELPHAGLSYDDLAVLYRRGDDLRECLRAGIVTAVLKIQENVSYLTRGVRNSYNGMERAHIGSLEERMELVELGVGAWELLKNCEWGAVWRTFAAVMLWNGAVILVEAELPERAMDYVERAVEYCRPVPGEKVGYYALGQGSSFEGGDAGNMLPSREARKIMLRLIEQSESDPEAVMHPLVRHPRWKALAEEVRNM